MAHKETVDLKVKFSPALLRKDYDLDLLLFMVCRGEEYASDTYAQVNILFFFSDNSLQIVDVITANQIYIDTSPCNASNPWNLNLKLFNLFLRFNHQGCLEAPSSDRYVAHRDGSFSFIPRVSNENGTTLLDEYNSSHVAEDMYQPLESQEYLREDESGQALAGM